MAIKKCTKCKSLEDASKFSKDCTRKDGLHPWCRSCRSTQGKIHHSLNVDKRRERSAKWRANNLEKARELDRKGHQRNKEKRNAYARTYRQNNLEAMRKMGRDRAKANLDKYRVYNSRRRAAKAHAMPIWAKDEFDSFVVSEMYDLASLRTELTGIDWHVDHSVPLRSDKVCGLHCMANLQVITSVENYSKGNRYWPQM